MLEYVPHALHQQDNLLIYRCFHSACPNENAK